jgi:intraflagellar transport protein 56
MQAYLQAFPDSVVAINVKACNQFKLYNGSAAKDEFKVLTDKGYNILEQNDLVSHNMVVFEEGQNALRTLPPLVESFSEARLNLVIYYLKHAKVQEAFELIKDIEPSTPQEYILKGVVHATLGQQTNSRQHIKTAQQYFQLVGSSPTECDTIPGRQCMASCFYLLKQFEDVNIYLNSIKQYMYNEDDFNWNYGISLCNTGNYTEALETLLRVHSSFYYPLVCCGH